MTRRPYSALLATLVLLAACSGRPTSAVVPDLSAPIASWLTAEFPTAGWQGTSSGSGVNASGGLTGTSLQFDHSWRIRAASPTVKSDELCTRLQKFVESEIAHRVTMITGRSSDTDSFGLTYKAEGARGGIVVFAHPLVGGGIELSMHQYEVY